MTNIDGFDDLDSTLEEMREAAEELRKRGELANPYTDQFMREFTDFDSFEEFIQSSNLDIDSAEELESVPDKELDPHVAEHTDFNSCEEMEEIAVKARVLEYIGVK